MSPPLWFAIGLLFISGGLMAWHAHTWRHVREQPPESHERLFLWRQFCRRMQASVMLGIVAVAIYFGEWIPPGVVYLVYWAMVVLVVIWVTLLAMADVVATRYHYSRQEEDQLVEKAKLMAELRRQLPDSNGDDRPPE